MASAGVPAFVLLVAQGCVSSGFYYVPSAHVPPDVGVQVRKAPCALPVGGPYAIFLTYPGLIISTPASARMAVSYTFGPIDADTVLSLRLTVGENHSIVTDLSGLETGMSGKRYYYANVPAGKVEGNAQVRGGSGGTYNVIVSNTDVAPPQFQLLLPSLLLDGREIGPVEITFTRHSGMWTEPVSC